jgi:hypothetical protein
MTNDVIVKEAIKVHREHWRNGSNVSGQTRNAQKVTKKWQAKVSSHDVDTEVRVSGSNGEKIDVVDKSRNVAYELKVSGKNAHHEFYKDVFKVFTYNLNNFGKISELVFITEENGISNLKRRLDSKLLDMLKGDHGISVRLVSI